jgi:hypothetical protein
VEKTQATTYLVKKGKLFVGKACTIGKAEQRIFANSPPIVNKRQAALWPGLAVYQIEGIHP